MRAAIVEDSHKDAQSLMQYLKKYGEEHELEVSSVWFDAGEDLLTPYNGEYDVILLDVQMSFMNGFQVAQEIRKVDKRVSLIFITSMVQYAIHGYSVEALDYLAKPVAYQRFSSCMDRVLKNLKRHERHFIPVSVPGGIVRLETENIRYVECRGHDLFYHTADGCVASKGTLKEVEETLRQWHFIRCHSGYLVNLNHVKQIRNNDILVGDTNIPLSRAKKKAVTEAFIWNMA